MFRRSLAAALFASLLVVPAVQAAPPERGQRAPLREAPTSIADGHVGPVLIGPRSYCGPIGTGTVQAASLCVDVKRRGCQEWVRSGGATAWKRGRMLFNDSEDVFWTGPYSRGYQWIWSLGDGYSVVATRCLIRYEAIFS